MDLFEEFITDEPMGLSGHIPGFAGPTGEHVHGHAQVQLQEQMHEIRNLPVREMGEKKGPRLRRSCELCRNSKGRCCPSPGGRGCVRCVKEGKQCVFLEAKPRPKRAKNSRIRVAEMEEKLEGLVALLQSNAQTAQNQSSQNTQIPDLTVNGNSNSSTSPTLNATSSSASVNTPPQNQPAQSSKHLDHLIGFSLQAPLAYTGAIFPFPDYVFADMDDCISKGMVSFEEAEESLKYFRSKAQAFPFVICPEEEVDSLRRKRPFLLLAILTYAHGKNRRVQEALEHELKESLGRRVIMDGEKSLDLLQGLLVYLAWYHMYFQPGKHQMYQFCQMAAAMAVDLGINKSTHESNPLDMLGSLKSPTTPKSTLADLEERRTFLGTYYMTASYCQGLRRASHIKLNDYGEECCQILSQVAVTESDHLIPYFVRLQKLADDINTTFDYDNNISLPELDSTRIEILINGFEEQFKKIETSFPENIWNNSAITLTYHSQKVYLHEIGFHATPPPPPTSKPMSNHSWYTSPIRTTHLHLSLQSSKDYLDRVLSLTNEELENFILPDFIRLVYAILIIGSLTTYFSAPGFDRARARVTANVDFYLDRMMEKMEGASKSNGEEGNLYMGHIGALLGHYKTRFSGMGENLILAQKEREMELESLRGEGEGRSWWACKGWWDAQGKGQGGTVGLLSFADMMPSELAQKCPSEEKHMASMGNGGGSVCGVELMEGWEGILDGWEGGLGEGGISGMGGMSGMSIDS